jgi:hypothetical protein
VISENDDVLIHVIGQSRYDSLREDVEQLLLGQQQLPTGVSSWSKDGPEHRKLRADVESLKRRIAGIEYRG